MLNGEAQERQQEWFCEECGTEGSVPCEAHADVWTVATAIWRAHGDAAPKCAADPRVRVR